MEWSDVITVSMLEVYNENIRDLLADNGGDTKLEVKMGEFGNHVPGNIFFCDFIRNIYYFLPLNFFYWSRNIQIGVIIILFLMTPFV